MVAEGGHCEIHGCKQVLWREGNAWGLDRSVDDGCEREWVSAD